MLPAALGSIQEAAAACALAVDAVAAAGAARARTKSGAPPAEDDDGDSEEEHEVTVDGEPEHAPLAQLSRALSRDASLAERLIVGPCLRANWSSPERRRALKAAATSLKVLRAGAAPGDSAALTAKLLARAAPAATTRDDAQIAAQLATAAKTLMNELNASRSGRPRPVWATAAATSIYVCSCRSPAFLTSTKSRSCSRGRP